MTFADFSKHLSKIEATPKRLEITDLLVELIRKTDSKEVEMAVNLSLGQLAPLYKDINFNIAEKIMIKAVAKATDKEIAKVTAEFKTVGDLGETVEIVKNKESGIGNQESRNSVVKVYERLLVIALDSGENSQERKIEKTADLLRELDALSAKYAVRIILGNLRLGFSDRTVLDALSKLIAGDKSARKKLEEIYNVRPDIGWMTAQIRNSTARLDTRLTSNRQSLVGQVVHAKSGRKFEIRNFTTNPELGTPILPSLCQRLEGTEEIIEKMGTVAAEPKWDGQRIQAHAWIQGMKAEGRRLKESQEKKVNIKLFTRSLEDVTSMFPDLVDSLRNLIESLSSFVLCPSSFVLDGEVVAFDPKTNKILPFQTMITRKRKYGVQEQLLDVPVRYMVFDIMYLNGKSLMSEPFSERRLILEKLINRPMDKQINGQTNSSITQSSDRPLINSSDSPSLPSVLRLAPQLVSSDPIHIRDFLKAQIDSGLEGIVAKRLDSPYSPGRTGFSWVKLKWEGKAKSGGLVDTVDCVVMGIYAGQGKRAGFGAGAFLVGVLKETGNRKQETMSYATISKIGTGLSDEQWRELKAEGQRLKAEGKPKEYDVPKELTPDTWLKPELVVEIQADNITASPLHTAGFALRFPRLVRYRDDKSPQQVTTVKEVEELYKMQ